MRPRESGIPLGNVNHWRTTESNDPGHYDRLAQGVPADTGRRQGRRRRRRASGAGRPQQHKGLYAYTAQKVQVWRRLGRPVWRRWVMIVMRLFLRQQGEEAAAKCAAPPFATAPHCSRACVLVRA